jgi:hypothetical protein
MGKSEAINRRTRDNTMVKRKRTKGKTIIFKALHKNLKIEQHEPHKMRGEIWCSDGIKQFLLHYWHHPLSYNTDIT